MIKPLVAGNWKMNGSRESIRELLDGILAGHDAVEKAEVAVCAPFVYLAQVADDSDAVEMALARWRQLTAHEVGHTLGFPHNYMTSAYERDMGYRQEKLV